MPAVSMPYPDPPLRDAEVGLRRWRETDLECVRLAATDPRIPAGTTVPAAFTDAEGLSFIRRQLARAHDGDGVSQAITEVDTDRAVGLMWLAKRPQGHVAGIGYWVVPTARGRGMATAAVRLVVPWALETLNLLRVEAWVEPQNVCSQRVLINAGFEQEGRLRKFLVIDGQPSDALVFSLVAPGR